MIFGGIANLQSGEIIPTVQRDNAIPCRSCQMQSPYFPEQIPLFCPFPLRKQVTSSSDSELSTLIRNGDMLGLFKGDLRLAFWGIKAADGGR